MPPLLSLTGDASAWGDNAQKAIALATEEINTKGGIHGKRINMIYEDTAGDPKRAVSAYQKVTSIDDVTAVIGPLTQTEEVAITPLIDKTGVPAVVPGFVPMQNRKNLYNPLLVWMDPPTEAERMAQYVFNQGVKNVGILGTQDSWEKTVSNSFAPKFTELGGRVIRQEMIQPTATDAKLPITRIIATNPQGVFLGTYYQFINGTKALHDLSYGGNIYSIEVDDYLAGQTYTRTQGLRFVAPDFYTTDFVSDFKNKYGRAPGLPAGQSYDATNILFSFLNKSTDQNDILQAMKNFSEYQGVSGKLQITSDGKTLLPTAIFEIGTGGGIKRVENIK